MPEWKMPKEQAKPPAKSNGNGSRKLKSVAELGELLPVGTGGEFIDEPE